MTASDVEQLERAIHALEAQRSVLGDDVVETAVAPLRSQLAALTQEPRTRRRQVTIMFADLSGFTTLSEHLDPEALARMLSEFWAGVDGIISAHRGHVLQHMADGVLAVWSDTRALEDDAHQAVTAGLKIVEWVEREGITVSGERVDATVSIGINTGPVHLSSLDDFGYTTLGDTTNVAARLESAAGAGEVWISRSTHHQVRGLFEVVDMGERQLKGRTEPVRAYRVLREHAIGERQAVRGLEEADTRLVGRAEERRAILTAVSALVERGRSSSLTLIGEPGIGKSRLLRFARQALADVDSIDVIDGWAVPNGSGTPFAVLRNALAREFSIQDTDDPETALDKLRAGFSTVNGTGDDGSTMARSVGWLAGFVAGASGLGRDDAQFRRNAAISDFFEYLERRAGTNGRLAIVLEDLHWADDDSLELFEQLAARRPPGILILASTRPSLLGDRPSWGLDSGLSEDHDAIRLHPLTGVDVDDLLAQLLEPMGPPPEALRVRIREQCDGNPFHIEELVRMLIDDRVIDTSTSPWRFDGRRLRDAKVPSTLTGVLQARLDRLSTADFEILQAGSLFGRYFWDRSVSVVLGDAPVQDALERLHEAELVTRQPQSRLVDAIEYAFRHDFTRVVTYDTIDIERRPALHGLAADWLVEASGARADETALTIAQHYESAGRGSDAATWYRRAARRAQGQSSYTEAARLFALAAEHALPDGDERLQLVVEQSYSLVVAGRFDEAKELLESLMEMAEIAGLTRHWLLACTELSRIALFRDGDFARARQLLSDGLQRGEAAGHIEETLLVRHQLGNLAIVDGDFEEAIRVHAANVERADAGGELFRRGWALNSLAHSHAQAGHHDEAQRLADETIEAAAQLADPRLEMAGLAQKGLSYLSQGAWDLATHWFEQAQRLNRRNGDPEKLATVANYLGECATGRHDLDEAHRHFDEARAVSVRAGVRTELVRSIVGLAEIAAERGDRDLAQRAITSAAHSPAAQNKAHQMISLAVARSELTLGAPTDAVPIEDAAAALESALGQPPHPTTRS